MDRIGMVFASAMSSYSITIRYGELERRVRITMGERPVETGVFRAVDGTTELGCRKRYTPEDMSRPRSSSLGGILAA